MERPRGSGILFLVLAALLAAISARDFAALDGQLTVYPGPGVVAIRHLSDYLPSLKATPGDTAVYVLDSGVPGASVLVVGGTHADEPAGTVACVLLAERAIVQRGRVFVIPQANHSGFTHNLPQEGHPHYYEVGGSYGVRRFCYGARVTNPVHQWPDPVVYVERNSGQKLAGTEARNLNRAYPGNPKGSLTERVASAITALIKQEKIDVAFDLHESSPEYPVINTMVVHPKGLDLAAMVAMNLQAQGIDIGMEPSPETLRGLSHREWGDSTQAISVLIETPNAAQGRLRGKTGSDLVTSGRDRFYVAAAERGRLFVPFDSTGHPLEERVARHLAVVGEFLNVYSDMNPQRAVVLTGIPGYEDLMVRGLGDFLALPGANYD